MVRVNYITTDGTAKAGQDYVAKSGLLTFAPGETLKRVVVQFAGDSVAELNETFFLDLKNPICGTIATGRGGVYIKNDDGPGISINNAITINEGPAPGAPTGTTAQTFTVTLSAASTNIITVNWTTLNNTAGPNDFVGASGTLSFAPGETEKTISVQVKGDTLVEPTETYRVRLSSPRFAILSRSVGIGYIRNDDSAPALTGTAPSR
jgi:chitinase